MQNKDIDPRPLVSFGRLVLSTYTEVFQLLGIVRGLEYLHNLNSIHGDLRGVSQFTANCTGLD